MKPGRVMAVDDELMALAHSRSWAGLRSLVKAALSRVIRQRLERRRLAFGSCRIGHRLGRRLPGCLLFACGVQLASVRADRLPRIAFLIQDARDVGQAELLRVADRFKPLPR